MMTVCFSNARLSVQGTMQSVTTGKTVIWINSQINVGNLYNTSHSTGLTPLTALAEHLPTFPLNSS
jgi:hypothetical protein